MEISDRITQLLTKKTSSLGDIGTAAIRSSTGLTTFGEQLNKLRADRINEETALFNVLSKVKEGKRADKRIEQADTQINESLRRNKVDESLRQASGKREQSRLDMELEKFRIAKENNHPDAVAIDDAVKQYVRDENKSLVLSELMKDKRSVNAGNAASMVSEVRERLIQQNKIKRVPDGKISPTMHKVKDDNSPTGWSYSDGKRLIIGAPAPSGGRMTRINKDGSIDLIENATPSQLGKYALEAKEKVEVSDANLAELDKAMEMLDAEGGADAVGLVGAAHENIGGVAEQVLGWMGAEDLEKQLALKNYKVQRVRSHLVSLFGRYLPAILNEENSRYSDADRTRAEAALPAQKPLASATQIVSALKTIQAIEIRARAREKMKLDGIPDLTYSENAIEYMVSLIAGGVAREEAIKTTADLRRKYGVTGLYGD